MRHGNGSWSLSSLDLMMPRTDDFETLKELKKEGNLADIPAVVLTARRGSEDTTLARPLGAIDYLNKPWNGRWSGICGQERARVE